jgi:hypothetical protein
MYCKYGNYTHDPGEVAITMLQQQRMYSKRNRLMFSRYRFMVQGHICDTGGQDSLRTKINALQNAYKYDHYDFSLYHDDGTLSAHYLPVSGSINGVRVRTFDFPEGDKAEYATGRSYRIVLEADYLNIEDTIYAYNETLTFIGSGGPQWELVPHFLGPPTVHITYSVTPQKIIQEGSAIGVNGNPIVPGPILPLNYEHQEKRMVKPGSPLSLNIRQNLMYPVQYRYVFSSALPQSGYPREDYH